MPHACGSASKTKIMGNSIISQPKLQKLYVKNHSRASHINNNVINNKTNHCRKNIFKNKRVLRVVWIVEESEKIGVQKLMNGGSGS